MRGVEGGAVVHVGEVGDFVGDGGLADIGWGKDQAPVVADRARGRATAPAGLRVANAYLIPK